MNSFAPTVPTTATLGPVPAGAATRGAGSTPGVRLTRRGRLVVFALAFLIVTALAVVWSSTSVATPEQRTEVVVVQSGDTLWGIAQDTGSDAPITDVVTEIRELNELDSAEVMAGQRLVVPA